jgi:predicted nucleic-acid-binding Zn-ribbon protein
VAPRAYSCEKCGGRTYDTEEIRTTGSGFSRFLNMQNKKFAAVSCRQCGFTEMYRMRSGGRVADIFDVLSN